MCGCIVDYNFFKSYLWIFQAFGGAILLHRQFQNISEVGLEILNIHKSQIAVFGRPHMLTVPNMCALKAKELFFS